MTAYVSVMATCKLKLTWIIVSYDPKF